VWRRAPAVTSGKKKLTEKSPSIVRLELFSDAVIAIVLTIMALELKLPELHESAAPRWSYGFLVPEMPKLLSYALGFYFVGTTWVAHLQVTRQLQHSSIRLISLNLLYLFFVSLLPAATAFLGNHPTLPQAMTLSILVATSIWIVGDKLRGAAVQLGVATPRWVPRRNRVMNGVFVLAIIGTQLSVYIGWVLAFIAASMFWIPGRLASRVFVAWPATDAVIPHADSASCAEPLSDGCTETEAAEPTSGSGS
jgi:uncharacterized membrane protein